MPSISEDVRGAIKTALANVNANVYDHVPEAPQVPAVLVIPSSPYMEMEVLGKVTTRVKLNYTITAPVIQTSVRSPINSMAKFERNKQQARCAVMVYRSPAFQMPNLS